MGFFKKVKKAILGGTDTIGLTDTKATDRALDLQRDALTESRKTLKDMYNQAVDRAKPYSETGRRAMTQLEGMNYVPMANFEGGEFERFSQVDSPYRSHSGQFAIGEITPELDPGYQFRLDQGRRALERMQGAKGGRVSGASMRDLLNYNQDFASNEYDRAYNRQYQKALNDQQQGFREYQDARNAFNQDRDSEYGRRLTKYGLDLNNYNMGYDKNYQRLGDLVNLGAGMDQATMGYGMKLGDTLSRDTIGFSNAAANAEMNRNKEVKDLWGKSIEGGLSLASVALMACWVARAIFGVDNIKWRYARHYVLNIAPDWFREFYLKHGEEFAKVVEKTIFLKLALRPLFEIFALIGKNDIESEVLDALRS